MVIYLIASKNVKAIVTGSIFLLAVYSFFAFTYIGDGNMMIRRGDALDAYCSWLFSLLAKVRTIVGDKPDSDAYWRRYCAFMGERLLSVYIEANHLPVLGVEERLKKWWIKPLGKIRRIFGISRSNKLFNNIYNRIGYRSSYK